MKCQTIENISWEDGKRRTGEWTIEMRAVPADKIIIREEPSAPRPEKSRAERKLRPFFVEEQGADCFILLSRPSRYRDAVRAGIDNIPCAVLRKRESIVKKEAPKEEPKHKRKELGLLRDIRPFLNTIARSAVLLQSAGLDVDTVISEEEDKMEVRIILTKNSRERNLLQAEKSNAL